MDSKLAWDGTLAFPLLRTASACLTSHVETLPQLAVPDLKARVAEASGVPADRQRIIFRGHVLRDSQKLSDHGQGPPTACAPRLHPPNAILILRQGGVDTLCVSWTQQAGVGDAGVEDGHTLHMVERPPDAPDIAAAGSASSGRQGACCAHCST